MSRRRSCATALTPHPETLDADDTTEHAAG
jgi:hypothetical protein